MRDTIAEEDLLIDVTKTEIEKELLRERKEKDLMREELDEMKKQMALVSQLTQELFKKIGAEHVEHPLKVMLKQGK